MTGFTSMLRGLVFACVLGLGSVGGSAFAAPPQPGGGGHPRQEQPAANRVKVDVMVVYANSSGKVDPRLRELSRELAMFQKFTGFQVLSTHTDTLAPNQSTSFALEGRRKMDVTMLSRDEAQARVRIELYSPTNEKTLDTTVSIHRGKSMIVGGFKYQEGKLILPVSVSY